PASVNCGTRGSVKGVVLVPCSEQQGNVRIGVFPKRKEVVVGLPGLCSVSRTRRRAREPDLRRGILRPPISRSTSEHLLEQRCRLLSSALCKECRSANITTWAGSHRNAGLRRLYDKLPGDVRPADRNHHRGKRRLGRGRGGTSSKQRIGRDSFDGERTRIDVRLPLARKRCRPVARLCG